MIKLSELKDARAAMTPGLWEPETWHGSESGGWRATGPHRAKDGDESDEPGCDAWIAAEADAAGIVATHNAADVLIEIAEAAQRYIDAKHAYNINRCNERADRMDNAEIELYGALLKVKP